MSEFFPPVTPTPKNTRQRAAIAAIFADSDGFRSANQVYETLHQSGNRVSLATIYRNLQMMADFGELETVRSEDGETLYRKCPSNNHHHHLVCRNCGKSVDVGGQDLESWLSKVAFLSGFTNLTHRIELFGMCKDCQNKN